MLRRLLADSPEMNGQKVNGIALSSPPVDPFPWQQLPTQSSSVSGTSELFSSTFAMLSDTTPSFPELWNDTKQNELHSGFYFDAVMQGSCATSTQNLYDPMLDQRFQQPHSQLSCRPSVFGQQIPPTLSHPIQTPSNYHQFCNILQMPDSADAENEQYPHKISPMQTPINSRPFLNTVILPQRTSTLSPSDHILLNSPTMTSNSGSGTSETSPIGGEVISTDLEGPDNERVMCMACRGVYPSRRSLTGHIGRNEKCREIIGRNYLDQVASGANPVVPGTENAIKAGALTNGQDGLSPICPYCDRFISHYKGNIRRHINQCGKNESGQKRPRADKDQRKDIKRRRGEEELLPPILHEGFEPVPQIVAPPPPLLTCSPVMSPPMNSLVSSFLRVDHKSSEIARPQDNSLYPTSVGTDRRIQLPADPSPPGVTRKDQEPPEDAYICDHCEFVTIYKGNMKRHLNTCHPAPDCKDLKEWDRKLESMRASVLGISKENMIERLNAHKLNSTRGRKPRGKRQDEQQTQIMPQEHSQMRYNYDMMSFPNL